MNASESADMDVRRQCEARTLSCALARPQRHPPAGAYVGRGMFYQDRSFASAVSTDARDAEYDLQYANLFGY
jgi:hypothetical protein